MSAGPQDPAALQADIERTREDLAQTVDQLTAKLDVKSRVRESVTTDGRPATPVLVAGGVVLAGVVAMIIMTVRRRRG